MTKPVPDLLLANYPFVAKDILRCLLDLLISVRTHFSGDLDAFVVFLLIALRTAADPRAQQLDMRAVLRGEVDHYPSLLTNVRSVAASTNMPYETVRRKVSRLMELGWVERRDGSLVLTVQASREFTPLRTMMFEMIVAHHALVARLLAGDARA